MRFPALQHGVALAALASLAGTACSPGDRRPPEAETAAAAPAIQVDDVDLETYVRARFQTDPGIRARNVQVSADGGIVTLRGLVVSEQARAHLVSTAREINGVRSVNDELTLGEGTTADSREAGSGAIGTSGSAAPDRREVHTPAPLDLATRVQAEFFKDDDVRGANIEVSATEAGVVTLRGEAEAALVSEEASRIARGTSGVSRVDNRIRLAGEPERVDHTGDRDRPLDPWVTAKVQAKFFTNDIVKGRDINVDTNGGAVTLTGKVDSEAEKRLAVALARNTDGVHSVNDQLRIEVDPDRDRDGAPMRGRDAGRDRDDTPAARLTEREAGSIDDAWITTKIQSRYFLEPDVKGGEVDVDTAKGVVTLSGRVDSAAERRLAETIARETDGVSRVVNRLQVKGPRSEK